MNYCQICGKPISETNQYGIGYECRKILEKLQREAIFKNEAYKKRYFDIEKEAYIKFAKEQLSKSSLYEREKEFISSLISFYEEKGFLSRKQFEAMDNLFQKVFMAKEFGELQNKVKAARKEYIESISSEIKIRREDIEIERQKIKKKIVFTKS